MITAVKELTKIRKSSNDFHDFMKSDRTIFLKGGLVLRKRLKYHLFQSLSQLRLKTIQE